MAASEEEEARKMGRAGSEMRSGDVDESGTETEAAEEGADRGNNSQRKEKSLRPPEVQGVRQRLSFGEQSGDVSTDSEWEKVEEEGRADR